MNGKDDQFSSLRLFTEYRKYLSSHSVSVRNSLGGKVRLARRADNCAVLVMPVSK